MDWISIHDDLPEDNKLVLVCDNVNQSIALGKMDTQDDKFWFYVTRMDEFESDFDVTHWRELPLIPECE